jgi:ATP adenylyltransferase
VTNALVKKPTFQNTQPQTQQSIDSTEYRRPGSDICTTGYEIADVGTTHILVANKFCFARPHLVLLTLDGHKRQFDALNHEDLAAAWNALKPLNRNYVAFYNCGKEGGCSRLHKHLQLMPMAEECFASFLEHDDDREPCVPFEWFHKRLHPEHTTVAGLVETYRDLLEAATGAVEQGGPEKMDTRPGATIPHNVIFTRRWMVVIPRRRGAISNNKIAANALGMLGYIAVSNKKEVGDWVQFGPTEALGQFGVLKEANRA